MTHIVLDASAVLALLLGEPDCGEGQGCTRQGDAWCRRPGGDRRSLCEARAARPASETLLRSLPIRVVPVDADLSFDAGLLRPQTLPGGLSPGDRYCLALAKREDVPALTAERRWPDIAAAAGVTVEMIR